MSLQKKVFWLILVAFLASFAVIALVQFLFILPSFYDLEREESITNMDRAVEIIDNDIQNLDATAKDWSFWDDTYQFVQDQNEDYIEANLDAFALSDLKVNLLYIFDADHQLIWGMVYDEENQAEVTIPEFAELLGGIRTPEPESKIGGVLITSFGPMLISATPILTSRREGPVMGTFVLGRLLNPDEIANQARISLSAAILATEEMDPERAAIIAELDATGESLVRQDRNLNRVYHVLADVNNKPAILLRVDVPRTISARGERSVMFAMVSLLVASIFILAVLIMSIHRMVLIPLKQLTDHAVDIGQNDKHYTPLAHDRKDEIGILGQEFDRMVERLELASKILMDQSYYSGMAEVATGILHNVGNVLNSVNVSCNLLLDQLRESRVGNVSRLADLMANPEGGLSHFLTEDARGQQIPDYLASLAPVLQEEHQLLLREAQSLQSQIEHIKQIVIMQQNYSGTSSINETIPPDRLMEDVIKIESEALARHEITLQRDYQEVPPITVDKHKVLQILLNLVSNAKYACSEGEVQNKIITLRIFSTGNNILSLQVADNGIGILPENMTNIFQYGFSTRKSGHGFGLHISALTARKLGGNLSVQSDGLNQGATFTLELPYHPGDRT